MAEVDRSRQLIGEMNRYYEARAPWHDSYMSYTSEEAMEKSALPILEAIEDYLRGKLVLEIACGTGNWTQVLARRAAEVVAVDISPSALEIARRKLAGCNNVILMEADAYDLSGVEQSFDVVFAADWWSHVPIGLLPAFLADVFTKLAPCGRAIFTDMTCKEYFRNESCYYDADQNRLSRRKLPNGSEYEVIKNFPTEPEIRSRYSGLSRALDFREFSTLERWLLIMQHW